MVVIILKESNNKVKGILTHFMYEIQKNVFVGNVNTRVRTRIEEDVIRKNKVNACIMYDSIEDECGIGITDIGDPKIFYNTLGSFLVRHK